MPKITQLAGILCVGKNHNQAVENFRRTALGQNLMIYGSADGVGYASQSGADLYNPNGGEELLDEHPDLVEKAEVQSQSSAGDVKAHYTICLDSCGSHIISDSSALIQGSCPSCSADLSEITDERVTQHLAESAADEHVEHEGLVATGETAEAAQRNFAQALSNAQTFTALSGTGSFNAATAAKFDPYTGQPVESLSAVELGDTACSLSSGDNVVEAHIYSCSANCEQPFTVSSDEEPVFCAHCSATLVDEAIDSESGDDSDIDILDEDDLDLDDDDLDDEDDEDFDSESGSDDDEDLDDEDLDDEDFDEEDFDEDLDDEDDEDFDSESSSDDEDDLDLDDDEDLDEDDLDLDEDMDDEDFDSESGSDEDEDDFEDEEELEEDDLDLDDDDFDSESNSVVRTFDSLSTVTAQHGTLDPALISMSRATGKVNAVHMYYDGNPVARATLASVSHAVGEETALKSFETDNFIRAVSHSLKEAGVAGTCEAFGFLPYQIEMPVDKLLVAESDARISEATADVAGTIDDAVAAHNERFVAALSTSQLGITKNFWGDVRNPIVDSLVSSLAAAGIRDARPIVERAFIAHGKDFLTVALSKAQALMSKSEVAQNEIAESIDAAAGTVSAEKAPVVTQQQVVTAPTAPKSAAQLLTQTDAPVASQSSASVGSTTFEDKLSRLRF